jgi:hypothetical protein
MATSRTTAVLAAFSSAVSLLGCGTIEETPGTSGTLSVPAAPPPAAVAWADGVCSASSALRESVRQMTATVQTDPTGSATSLDQAKAQIADRAAAVRQSAAGLSTAVADVPSDARPELVTAQQDLRTSSQRAQQAVTQLDAAAGQVRAAQTGAEVAAALVKLKVTLTATATDVTTYLTMVRTTVDSGQDAVRAAFGAAPACAAVRAMPSS